MSTPSEKTGASRRPGRPRSKKDPALHLAGKGEHDGDNGDVRERLLDAATELAVEQGFDNCGLREIAARADVSTAMIAYYFGDRQGLSEAMFERALDRISEQVRAVLREPDAGGDRLEDLIRIQISAIAADPWLPILVMREMLSKHDSPWRERFGETVAEGPLKMMMNWLAEEQTRGTIRSDFDPRMLALTMASLAGFPFLMLPLIGDRIGLHLDDDFPDRLIEHNRKLLDLGLRAHTEKSE